MMKKTRLFCCLFQRYFAKGGYITIGHSPLHLRCRTLHCHSAPYSQIYMGDPRPCIPPRVIESSAMGLKLGVFGFFADHTWGNKCKKMLSQSSSARQRFTRAYDTAAKHLNFQTEIQRNLLLCNSDFQFTFRICL